MLYWNIHGIRRPTKKRLIAKKGEWAREKRGLSQQAREDAGSEEILMERRKMDYRDRMYRKG